jgi:hypothetical protein
VLFGQAAHQTLRIIDVCLKNDYIDHRPARGRVDLHADHPGLDRRTFAQLLLETGCRRTRATTGLDRGAGGGRTAGAQGPAFPQRRAVADLDRQTLALLVHLHPERIGLVESDRLTVIERSENGHRFTRSEDTTAHVVFRTGMLSRSYKPV